MKRKHSLVLAAVCMTAFIFSGCAGGDGLESDKSLHMESISIDTESREQDNTEDFSQDGADAHVNAKDSTRDEAGNQPQDSDNPAGELTDAELDEELARYRQEREDNIQEVGGLVEGGSPDESNYTFDMSGIGLIQFDTRETTEGFAAARIYVTDTLGIKPSTKMEVYMCVDPKVLAIYEDEDKGVAAGYDNSNIFVCEYCGEGNVWQYLILVRDGKGSAWEVIHHGSSYMEESEE
ncbi:MAG: hypothetical protein J1E98_09365 [Lachnospiraceae bacterium]|nr:hypothetical protein [Lachnospiraceae bacterium]